MPVCADPNATATFHLKSDADKPTGSRPEFIVRFVTARQMREARKLARQAYEEKDDDKAAELMDKQYAIGLVGWNNYGGDFSVSAISDKLTTVEQWELLWGWMNAVVVAENDRKGPDSPPPSVGDSSAGTVAAASVETSPTK